MKHRVFFSLEYNKDNWRAGQVRNMGKVDGCSTFSDNDWEEVKRKTKPEIKKWIDDQLKLRSCIVVLIGSTTSTREWVKYEIKRAYELGKGIVGIYIHGLKDKNGSQSSKGSNPFYNIYSDQGHRLSNYIVDYDTPYQTSSYVYDDIKENIDSLIQDAIDNAGKY